MIKVTSKVKKHGKKNPTSQYQLRVTFDDAPDIVRLGISPEEIEKILPAYDAFIERLGKDWNTWCNPESYQIKDLFEELEIIEEDEVSEYDFPEYGYWAWSEEYPDPYARVDGYVITYWDENGIEWHTEVQK